MEKKKVLFIFQEITPYLPESEKSIIGRYLPQGIQERGKEIRTFMPRYGCVNERRNQLHEVIRLSGMNLVINDTDHPLIIKVASIQAARMQVYFIDNEDYFQRKYVLNDKEGKSFADNDERALFYTKGVLETVIKLRWAPDLIYCQGWFGAMVPLLIKKIYFDDPLFANAKVVYSAHNDDFDGTLDNELFEKLLGEEIVASDIEEIKEPTYFNINKLAIKYADGVIKGSPKLNDELNTYIDQCGLPVLEYQHEDKYIETYDDFYDKILSNS
ncbi:MAG TPA: glycogen/starch synthase [Prolixibacteraceae bacterium]|nr:glycogen/starch synthase [Prolixibacteraceae bacterium]HPR59568.1 glycogen/starch synthase [Prolixibacteraceae bacterium]